MDELKLKLAPEGIGGLVTDILQEKLKEMMDIDCRIDFDSVSLAAEHDEIKLHTALDIYMTESEFSRILREEAALKRFLADRIPFICDVNLLGFTPFTLMKGKLERKLEKVLKKRGCEADIQFEKIICHRKRGKMRFHIIAVGLTSKADAQILFEKYFRKH